MGASWGSHGMIAFGASAGKGGLQRVSDTGGTPQPLTRLEKGEVGHTGPEFLPGGKAVLFAAGKGVDSVQIAVQSIETGKRRNLIPGGLTRDTRFPGICSTRKRGT